MPRKATCSFIRETPRSRNPSPSPVALGMPRAPWGHGRGTLPKLVEKALVLDSSTTTQPVCDPKVGGGGLLLGPQICVSGEPGVWSLKPVVLSGACFVNQWRSVLGKAEQSGGVGGGGWGLVGKARVGDRNYQTSNPGRGRADAGGGGEATGDPRRSRLRGSVAPMETEQA